MAKIKTEYDHPIKQSRSAGESRVRTTTTIEISRTSSSPKRNTKSTKNQAVQMFDAAKQWTYHKLSRMFDVWVTFTWPRKYKCKNCMFYSPEGYCMDVIGCQFENNNGFVLDRNGKVLKRAGPSPREALTYREGSFGATVSN